MALPRGIMGLSAVCDCGITLSYSLTIFAKTGFQSIYLNTFFSENLWSFEFKFWIDYTLV